MGFNKTLYVSKGENLSFIHEENLVDNFIHVILSFLSTFALAFQ